MTPTENNEPTFRSDVCIVGGGPAGLVLAAELAARDLGVVVLESGPSHGPARDLSRGQVDGDPIYALDLTETRHRQLGGNANLWSVKIGRDAQGWVYGVRYGTLTDLALDRRPWIDDSGWPLTGEQLDPWYRRAHELLAQADFAYDIDGEGDGHPGTASIDWLPRDDFERRSFRFGPRDRVLTDLRSRLADRPNVDVHQDATVTDLRQPSAGGPVDRVTYADSTGASHHLAARTVVLAGGGVENARLLLHAEHERGGIGNETDNVGRYFMDHPLWAIGDIRLDDVDTLSEFAFFDLRTDEDGARHDHLVTSRSWCEANRAVEIGFAFFPRPARPIVGAIETARLLAHQRAQLRTDPRQLVSAVPQLLPGLRHLPRAAYVSLVRKQSLLPGFGRGGWSEDPRGLGFEELELVLQCEQAPLRASRVTLSDERDRFGIPLPRVTWVLGDQTRRSVLALQRQLAERIEARSIGPYTPRAGNLEELTPPTSIAHHLGTTRMSRTAEDGVVDVDCRVHTCPNLFVAGSSVFPVGGYVNPTLTIAALAMRLADTIARESSGPTVRTSHRPAP